MLVHTTDSLVETLYSEKLAHKLKQSTSYCYERTQWPMPRISEVRKVWNSVKAWKVCVCKHTLDTAGRFVHRRARTKEDKSFCWSCCSFSASSQKINMCNQLHRGTWAFVHSASSHLAAFIRSYLICKVTELRTMFMGAPWRIGGHWWLLSRARLLVLVKKIVRKETTEEKLPKRIHPIREPMLWATTSALSALDPGKLLVVTFEWS